MIYQLKGREKNSVTRKFIYRLARAKIPNQATVALLGVNGGVRLLFDFTVIHRDLSLFAP